MKDSTLRSTQLNECGLSAYQLCSETYSPAICCRDGMGKDEAVGNGTSRGTGCAFRLPEKIMLDLSPEPVSCCQLRRGWGSHDRPRLMTGYRFAIRRNCITEE
jgi:hypothetical protein